VFSTTTELRSVMFIGLLHWCKKKQEEEEEDFEPFIRTRTVVL
jgi:hypothetical protein